MLNLSPRDKKIEVPERPVARGRTTTAEALLGMLALRPMSGYELRTMMARTTANFWQESFGQIYPALRKLVAEGLAEVEEQKVEGKRFNKTYRLTEDGRARLVEWMAMPCERQTIRDELLLKLFFGVEAPAGALLAHVRRHREELVSDLERYQVGERCLPEAQRGNPGLPYFLMTLRYGLLRVDADIRWCDETIAALEGLDRHGAEDKATNAA